MNAPLTVEFVGGPYDGYQHRLDGDAPRLVSDPAVPVSVDTIRAINGESHGPLLPCHRLAFYHLRSVNGQLQYCFRGFEN